MNFLFSVNAPLYEADAPRWMNQIQNCMVCEVNVPYCLSISHGEETYEGWENSRTLARELISIDEGVPVLIYAIADRTPAGFVLDSFNIDRLDGEPLVAYPEPGDGLMIMEAGKRIGGADLRHVFKESDLLPRFKLPRDRLDREAG